MDRHDIGLGAGVHFALKAYGRFGGLKVYVHLRSMCDLVNLNWFYNRSQLVNQVPLTFAVTGSAGRTFVTEVTLRTTGHLYLMYLLTTVVFAMMLCVGPMGPVVMGW